MLAKRCMSGHSKWATIKRKKGEIDAKKGKVFTKLVREITTAARLGGGDLNGNPRLRAAIAAAKAQRMPADNMERAIKKGTGALEGPPVEETCYEGYGPLGVAVFVEAQTDNRNRSVAWMFARKAQFVFDAASYSEETVMEVALAAAPEDILTEGSHIVVQADVKAFSALLDVFEQAGLKYQTAELTMVCDNTVKLQGPDVDKILLLIERLEDLDDVQKVYANFDIDEVDLERLAASGV